MEGVSVPAGPGASVWFVWFVDISCGAGGGRNVLGESTNHTDHTNLRITSMAAAASLAWVPAFAGMSGSEGVASV